MVKEKLIPAGLFDQPVILENVNSNDQLTEVEPD